MQNISLSNVFGKFFLIVIEINEIQITHYSQEWVEISRWIKYQETVEPEGNRWSKPHVSTPTLQGKAKSIIGPIMTWLRVITLLLTLRWVGGAELANHAATK